MSLSLFAGVRRYFTAATIAWCCDGNNLDSDPLFLNGVCRSARNHAVRTVICQAKQQQSFAFERRQGKISITIMDNKVSIPEQNAWQLAIPVLGVVAVASMLGK